MPIKFISIDHVIKIHSKQIMRYGGTNGIRDLNSLKSAVGMPCLTYGGQFLHPTIHEMASAYLFHIVKNHPFIDGNKRTGLAVALTFLIINGKNLKLTDDDLFNTTILVAQGKINKSELSQHIKNWTR